MLVNSNDYIDIIHEAQALVDSLHLNDEEIKWQKVNAFTFEKYKKIVDFIFQLLSSGKSRLGFSSGIINTKRSILEKDIKEMSFSFYITSL